MPAWRRRLFWFPEKLTASYCHALLSQSREDMQAAVNARVCSPDQLHYLGNGIDLRRFPLRRARDIAPLRRFGVTESDFVVGAVGRLVYEKGFAELFRAAEELTARHSNLRFLVVGPREAEQNDAVETARIQALTRRGAVIFADYQDDMARWYAAMDLFVLPSHREGVPRACMEAAATGLPVVASNIRGCREVVLDGETGLLVPIKNASALAAAIERLANDATLARQMGERGRRHIEQNFSNVVVLDRLLTFYDAIEASLGKRRAHA
jgi:glycosyltransferase involved in cell wall biosynthesis